MWFRCVSTRRCLEWVSVHTTPEASHAPSPAWRVPNKGRGVSESTRRGGDREEEPSRPCFIFIAHARVEPSREPGDARRVPAPLRRSLF